MSTAGFGIYIHWPFCTRICPYCDFTVYRARRGNSVGMFDAISADLDGHGERLGGRTVDTIFFGGGTPSLLDPGAVERLIARVGKNFKLRDDLEITLEANPEDAARFHDFAAAGVNRFSLGVQAFDDGALKALGRSHSSAQAIAAVETAWTSGRRVSIDLMYARHGQSPSEWRTELREALKLPAEHFSFYELTVKPGTAFERAAQRKTLILPDEDEAVDFYRTTLDVCADAGVLPYEVSNFARSERARAGHNLIYWRGGEWVGVGPGASGRITIAGARVATSAHTGMDDYVSAVGAHGVGWKETTTLSNQQIAEEALIMGLRLVEGVARAPIEALRSAPLDQPLLDDLKDAGLLEEAAGRIRLTATGRLLADRITGMLA